MGCNLIIICFSNFVERPKYSYYHLVGLVLSKKQPVSKTVATGMN